MGDLEKTVSPGPSQRLVNAAVRKGYQLAYLVRIWWFVRRPRTSGAAVALWHGDKVLMVRTSYRGCYSLPGGFARTGEPSEQAARRELREELGISVPPQTLRHAWHGTVPFESRQDTIDIWEATVDPAPEPHVTGREIVWADWVAPAEALKRPLLPHVAAYLSEITGHLATPRP
jgi:ADP-ribose pyrophosphatase YjhB (NUDIX family)